MLRPTQDYIVVKPIERKLSDVLVVSNSEKHCRGEVVAVGPGKFDKRGRLQSLAAQVGDIVIFGDGKFDFYPKYEENSIVYRVIQENDICGVLDREEADLAA